VGSAGPVRERIVVFWTGPIRMPSELPTKEPLILHIPHKFSSLTGANVCNTSRYQACLVVLVVKFVFVHLGGVSNF
jgi:hypothetical protein